MKSKILSGLAVFLMSFTSMVAYSMEETVTQAQRIGACNLTCMVPYLPYLTSPLPTSDPASDTEEFSDDMDIAPPSFLAAIGIIYGCGAGNTESAALILFNMYRQAASTSAISLAVWLAQNQPGTDFVVSWPDGSTGRYPISGPMTTAPITGDPDCP